MNDTYEITHYRAQVNVLKDYELSESFVFHMDKSSLYNEVNVAFSINWKQLSSSGPGPRSGPRSGPEGPRSQD